FVLSQNNLSQPIRDNNLTIIHSFHVTYNAVVFPGGVTESADGSNRWWDLFRSFGYSTQDFEVFHRPNTITSEIFKNNPIQRHLQLRITAIRETFEELGLLICSRGRKECRDGNLWANTIEGVDLKHWQNRVSKNPEDLITLCEEYQCYPDIWSLYYWSNWLSPITLPKRFDTAFFIAAIKDKPDYLRSSSEVVKVEWLPPGEVLNSDRKLQPPQIYEFLRLSHVKDIEELITFASERSGHGTNLSYPFVVKAKDGALFTLPGDDLYPSSVDYNDNKIKYIDQTILELRESSKSVHRIESKENCRRLVIQNYKPEHHIEMENKTYEGFATA
ncbi:nucleoside diphosphate-linked moiety X motif 19-like, partial [Spodoptera litura]|uniref:Nucleoside diphosphate-linked moiety X motif 19-like n=1 Tax=Spodoptera litura TaxID=69820 RepID=A0A9J7IN60_SPOLT